MSSPKDLPAVAPKTRMTVTRVGHKIDDLHETVDTLHQEIEEIKIVLKNLVKLQLDVEENKKEDKKDFMDPFSDKTVLHFPEIGGLRYLAPQRGQRTDC